MSYSSQNAAASSAIGNSTLATQTGNYVQSIQSIDQRMADYLNASGGLAGCPVQLVYHDFQTLASDGFSAESQKECSDFATDHHALAVINQDSEENKTLISCLAQHQVVSLFGGVEYYPNPSDFAKYRGYLYQPDWINPYRFGSYISLLSAAGFITSRSKVGILEANDGSGTDQYLVEKLWLPSLQAMGIAPKVYQFDQIESYSGVSQTASEMQSGVLQFKAAGVDRVLFTPDGSDGALFFTSAAETQGYRPTYGMTSDSNPWDWSTVSAGQRPNAMAVSNSLGDIGSSGSSDQLATNGNNTNRARCVSIYQGHTYGLPIWAVFQLCDEFFFLRSALSNTQAATASNLLTGADRLGSSFALSNGYSAASLGQPNHYDGGSSVRVMKWNESAQQWQYVASPQQVP